MSIYSVKALLFFLVLVPYSEVSLFSFTSGYFDNGQLRNNTDMKEGLWFSPQRHQIFRKAEAPPPLPTPILPDDPGWNLLGSDFENHRDALTEERLQHHLHYIMSSTAEQPDSGGRLTNFNFWLTLLIAALAAAILS